MEVAEAVNIGNSRESTITETISTIAKSRLKDVNEDTPPLIIFGHIVNFFRRPRFTRIWVLKEVFHASNISVCCGLYVAPGRDLC
jgi:hypothetical protein